MLPQRFDKIAAGLSAALLVFGLSHATVARDSHGGAEPPVYARQDVRAEVPEAYKQAVETFGRRVREYVGLREGLEEKMPKLSKEASAEEIEAHKVKFQEAVRAARAGARQGELFTPEVSEFIRAAVRAEYKGRERSELKETVFEAENKGVPLRVNYAYPDTEEEVEMPPTLLLRLPQLPKQVRYRFVGDNLLLVDRENRLVLDIMPKALP